MNKLTNLIKQWAIERGLDEARPEKQVIKLGEEFGVLCQGLSKANMYQINDSIGDMYVVLTILAIQLDTDINDCVEMAYNEIKYIGYEVEPEFNVGDWIFNKQTNVIFKLQPGFEKNVNSDVKKKFFRHATPEEIAEEKERRWWAKHGRDVWHIKKGDVVIHRKTGVIKEIQKDETNPNLLYPGYYILCFSHDRKDVDNE